MEKKEENIIENIEEKVSEKPIQKDAVLEEVKKEGEDEILKDLIEPVRERTREDMERDRRAEQLERWKPKTKLGKEVKEKKIKDIDEILNSDRKILEAEIVDSLVNVKSDLISVGQSKGKFGGGKRRAWRQTQRKTKEGNVPTFSAFAVIGDENGHVGVGVGKSMETLPARDKAIRTAKLNIMKITRGDGSFDSVGGGNASVPFKVEGKAGSVIVKLIPAAPGTGLVVADELKKVLKLAGVKDVYSKTYGQVRTSFNLVKACIEALKKTNSRRIK